MAFEMEKRAVEAFFAKNEPEKGKKDVYSYPGAGYDYKVEPLDEKARQLPREFDVLDQLRVNAEHMVERTTMGGIFYEMFGSIKKWVKMLAVAIFAFVISILLFINGLYIFGAVALIMAFYYYGQYDIWIDRSQQHKQFAAIIPS